MNLQTLLLFAATELIFSFSPGPAAMLVAAHGLKSGFRASLAANFGIQAGNTIYLAISALGVGALMARSPLAFAIVKELGAAYLVFLGIRTIVKAGAPKEAQRALARPWAQGMLTQLSNPKAILFFGALLPQFLDPKTPLWPQYLVMFVIVTAGETIVLGFYGWLGVQGRRIASGRFAVWRARVSGAILIAIGAIFALAGHT